MSLPYAPIPSNPVAAGPRPSEEWCLYFRSNGENLLAIPWGRGADLSGDELRRVVASLQDFQLGESSEGHHLQAAANSYAGRTGDAAYAEAVRLFVAEEQRHSRDLGRFLRLAGVPLLQRSWTDSVFRRLRHGGLETMLCVLLTAELIAMVYYQAVRAATCSAVLQRLCVQILRDERAHLRFHTERLALLRVGRPRWLRALTHLAQGSLFAGTCLVVWLRHGRAFRAGGFSRVRYWREAWREWRRALRGMNAPRTGYIESIAPSQALFS